VDLAEPLLLAHGVLLAGLSLAVADLAVHRASEAAVVHVDPQVAKGRRVHAGNPGLLESLDPEDQQEGGVCVASQAELAGGDPAESLARRGAQVHVVQQLSDRVVGPVDGASPVHVVCLVREA
jgi:hypothetical protein